MMAVRTLVYKTTYTTYTIVQTHGICANEFEVHVCQYVIHLYYTMRLNLDCGLKSLLCIIYSELLGRLHIIKVLAEPIYREIKQKYIYTYMYIVCVSVLYMHYAYSVCV